MFSALLVTSVWFPILPNFREILHADVLNGTRCVERLVSGTDVVLFAPFDNLLWGKVPNKVHPQNRLMVPVWKCFDPVSDISHDSPRDVAESVVSSAQSLFTLLFHSSIASSLLSAKGPSARQFLHSTKTRTSPSTISLSSFAAQNGQLLSSSII